MSERPKGRELSEQSRRFNAKIADAVIRAEAEGMKVRPARAVARTPNECCPLGALNVRQCFEERYPASYEIPAEISYSFGCGFIVGFDGVPCDHSVPEFMDGYYLGRLYRARALRMHGGGE